MQYKALIGLSLGLLLPFAGAQAKTISQFTAESLVYFDYTHDPDEIIVTNGSTDTSYQSSTPLAATNWEQVNQWDNFGVTHEPLFNNPIYTVHAEAVSGKAVLANGSQYFAVNVMEEAPLSIDQYGIEVWQVTNRGDQPERVAYFSNPANTATETRSERVAPNGLVSMGNALYLIDTDGNIFQSINGTESTDGTDWTNIANTNQTVWDVAASDNKIYLGTDAGILVSTNGKNWHSLNTPFCGDDVCRVQTVAVSADDQTILADYERYVDGPSALWRKTDGDWSQVAKSKYGFMELAINGDRMNVVKRELTAEHQLRAAILTGNLSNGLTLQQRIMNNGSTVTTFNVENRFLTSVLTGDGIQLVRTR